MNIVYLVPGTYNSGGTERVLCNKANWLVRHGYDITIVTTDQKGRTPFYDFDRKIRMVDLDINFTEHRSFLKKGLLYFVKQRRYRTRLSRFFANNSADIVISMFGWEIGWLTKLRDGSKKVVENHSTKFFRLLQNHSGLWGVLNKLRSRSDEKAVRKYDRLVVLTHEDKKYWGNAPNIEVISNAVSFMPDTSASLTAKQAIAVGRLCYEKGYERMIDAWKIVHGTHPDWRLAIFGDGDEREALTGRIEAAGLQDVVTLYPPTADIVDRYMESSMLVLSSRYEGFGMVIVEAMACGVPSVSFACKCGPRDIITPEDDGLLVEDGDVEGLAAGIVRLIEDEPLRKRLGASAQKKVEERFSEEMIMRQWVDMFEGLMSSK